MCGLSVDGLELHGPVRRRGRVLAAFCELRACGCRGWGARAPGSAAHDPGPGRTTTTTSRDDMIRRVRARVQVRSCTCILQFPSGRSVFSVLAASPRSQHTSHYTRRFLEVKIYSVDAVAPRARHPTPTRRYIPEMDDRADRRGNPVERISYASIRAEWHPVISRPRLPSLQTNRRALRTASRVGPRQLSNHVRGFLVRQRQRAPIPGGTLRRVAPPRPLNRAPNPHRCC